MKLCRVSGIIFLAIRISLESRIVDDTNCMVAPEQFSSCPRPLEALELNLLNKGNPLKNLFCIWKNRTKMAEHSTQVY